MRNNDNGGGKQLQVMKERVDLEPTLDKVKKRP